MTVQSDWRKPCELDNLVSQSSMVNLSQYKRLENSWARAIADGKNVSVEVNVIYLNDSLRPHAFEIGHTIDGIANFIELIN